MKTVNRKTKKYNSICFTLIELLVVVAIIAILVSILLPVLGKARAGARAALSLSTLNGWGKGTMMFLQDNTDVFPFEGKKRPTDMSGTGGFDNPIWWANGVPPYLGQPSYKNMHQTCGGKVPVPPEKSIYTDPAAKTEPGMGGNDAQGRYKGGTGINTFWFYFNYVYNSELDNSVATKFGPTGYEKERITLGKIESPQATVLMLELRAAKEELSPADRYADSIVPSTGEELGLKRCRADFKYLAKRYQDGAHILFCDGHAKLVNYKYATEPNNSTQLDTNPSNSTYGEEVQTWNKPDLIWNPLGATTEE